MCKEHDSSFEELYRIDADRLTTYGTEVRYPDELYFPSVDEAGECIGIAERVKAFVLSKMGAL